ncbi:MAG: hypothetical protein JW910_09930 [Anaerolineae bacterium]|nr:hypothetical protein [Anaerolineae bacterium]
MTLPQHFRLTLLLALSLLLTVACTGGAPTQYFIVVTSTHEPSTLTALAGSVDGLMPEVTTPAPEPSASEEPTDPVDTVTPSPTIEGFPTLMPTAPPIPTALVAQIQVAEQVFERGRMFWLQPTREIWVMIQDEDDPTRGVWQRYEDQFVEGEPETDPELTPPADLIQPRRGFGKLWREEEGLRQALGWATAAEYGFVTRYEYRPGGYLDSEGHYVDAPGTHVLVSLGNEAFAFDEREQRWRLIE